MRQKREAFNKEREGIIKDTEALFRLRKKQASAAKAQVSYRRNSSAVTYRPFLSTKEAGVETRCLKEVLLLMNL